MSYLTGGPRANEIPPVDIFVFNVYKEANSEPISPEMTEAIVAKNSFSTTNEHVPSGQIHIYLLGFCCMINHGNPSATNLEHVLCYDPPMNILRAAKKIKKGEEILYDYVNGEKNLAVRKERLEKTWGINSEILIE